MLTKPSTKENTSFKFEPMCNQSGNWDAVIFSGWVGNRSAAMQQILTVTATILMGC